MKFYFDKFKKYAQFILENQVILDELTLDYFTRIRSSKIPMLRLLAHLTPDQHRAATTSNITNFLTQCLKDNGFEEAVMIIDQWKSNELLGLPREELEITDILTVSNIRKQTYIDFLDKYTQDLPHFRSVIAELDDFHIQFEKYAFDSYIAIHQEALANENEFVSSLVNNSVDGILAFDKHFLITEFNQVLEQWHGIKKEEVIGKEIFKVFSIYQRSVAGNPLMKALKGESTYIPESPFKDREGYYEANIVPLYDAKGNISGGLIITHDITKRKEAEEEVNATKHFLQEITDAVPNVIYLSDIASRKPVFVNKAVTSLAGYTPEEIMSLDKENLIQLVHPDDHNALEMEMDEIYRLKSGEVSELKIRIKHRDGRWRWIKVKSKVFRYDRNKKPLTTLRIFEDVTEVVEAQKTIQQRNEELAATIEELKAAEEEVRAINDGLEHRVTERTRELAQSQREVKRSEENLQLITDSMPAHISYIKSDFTYGFANKAYEKMFQIKREDIIGKTVKEVIGEKAFNNIFSLIKKALSGENVESEILQDYGSRLGKRWRRISLVPHRVDGKVTGIFVLVEDISELKNIQFEQEGLLLKLQRASEEKEKALKQLEKKNKDLERTNTDLDNFIYTASHDLKSPITNLGGLMSILKQSMLEKVNEKEEKLLEMMEASVQRLHKTIGDLVEITRHQKDLENAVEEPLSFAELSQEVREDIYHLIKENKANIQEHFEVEKVVYKRSNLRSILYNLLSNAIKFRTPDRPLEVKIKTFVKNDFIVLSVKDNGLGLNPNQQKKLFTLFRRMHKHVEGTGVGLYTIKRIVENNGGRIEVRSEEGNGAEFLVFLTPGVESQD